MKKTFLIFAAIFIASQLFSQDVEKITVTYNQTQNHSCIGLFPIKFLLKLKGDEPSSKRETATRIYDIKNMKSIFKSNLQKESSLDIVKFEKLKDGTFHIVVEDRNILYPKEDNVKIYIHQYINPDKNLSVYNFQWKKALGLSVAVKELNPQITIN